MPRGGEAKIAIIGGTGFEEVLEGAREIRVGTPYGFPPKLIVGEVSGREVVLLARHGPGHEFPPHKVNYRANIWALKALGVERILATNAVGAINLDIKPGDIVIPHDIIDFTRSRDQTFYEGPEVVHIDVTEPFCPELRSVLVEVARSKHPRVHDKGVIACTEGPRFETPAEIRALRVLGADLVGMTISPEAFLARELEMCYASICFVSNMAAGVQDRLTATEVLEMASKLREVVRAILVEAIPRIPEERNCPCSRALEGARI
ncbi:S-methyl-5'-thioadenosine phosphorylase [Candidatus Bathyarchaeota archaeon ex4484_135]|nr:MAG: S-methyl-5'-thioadenosine phosphorylase [Candidatus Bathyarchaeota archaeon ex4484_135]